MKIKTISGMENLDKEEQKRANDLFVEYYKRMERQLKTYFKFQAHIKVYEKQTKNKRYVIDMKVTNPKINFGAVAEDWDLARTIHKVCNKLMNEIESKMHSSDQHDKVRREQKKRRRS